MKKIFCTLLVLITSVVSAYAQDALTAKNVTIPQGSVATLEIDMTNSSEYGGFQFDLQLPAGISATDVQKAPRLAQMASFSLQMNLVDETKNIYRVLGKNDDRLNIGGNSGDALVYITLTPAASIQAGADLEAGQITGIVLSTINATDTKPANTTFTITISAPLATVTLNETSTTAPAASNGAVDVLVNRTINADEWSTICLPFDMTEQQVKDAFGEDVKVADLTGWSFVGSSDNIESISLQFSTVKAIESNHPFVIRVSTPITSFEVKSVTIDPNDYPDQLPEKRVTYSVKSGKTTKNYYGSMYGVYTKKQTDEYDLFLSNNKFWYSNGSTFIKAFRSTFWFTDKDDNVIYLNSYTSGAGARITMSFEDPTGINEIKAVEDDRYYNLSGQQVKPAKKGLYIQNGKKKIIK